EIPCKSPAGIVYQTFVTIGHTQYLSEINIHRFEMKGFLYFTWRHNENDELCGELAGKITECRDGE
ncbi:hypothetical protein, partial [Klebsiella michiganensis]|uniref:hypothetical protein n=1 Tax=Klebsiella michiganensis TaxID=1134687 RepID=UPI001B8156AD